ncbi:MAG TPA: tetratricopeptide repeat protein [Vicinamibacterales bacterium]|nr:tetratricopeptide repeat protein [Vicinamibacterales bacterium]
MKHALLALLPCAALLASSVSPAAAQSQAFFDALSELTAAVDGTYGDEGPRIQAALDRMDRALAAWDREIQAFERRLRSASSVDDPGAAAPVARRRELARMHATLGRMFAERGRRSDAQRELESAARLDPDDAEVHLLLGLLLRASGKAAEASSAFRQASMRDPGDPIKAYHAFRAAAAVDDARRLQEAQDALAAAYRRVLADRIRKPAVSDNGSGRFTVFLHRADTGRAVVLVPAAYVRGYAQIAEGDYDGALVELRRAAAADPLVSDPATRSSSIRTAITALKERAGEARGLLEREADRHDSSEVHRLLGLAYWVDSQDEASIAHLELAVRRNGQNERARIALSRVLASAGRDEEAERVLLETLDAIPDSALACWWLANGYERVNRFADARRLLERAARGAAAGRLQIWLAIGRLAANAADVAGAVETFDRAVEIYPNDAAARRHLAAAFLQQNRADEAFAELVAAVLVDPREAASHAEIGRIHLDAGRYDDAVAALRHAIALAPDHVEARYALATALLRLGRADAAAEEFERVAEAQRRMIAERRRDMTLDVLREEAALRAAEGHHGRAVDLWRQVIGREPERPSNHLGLARALLDAGRVDEAISEYERAAELGAEPAVYLQLADLYAKAGRMTDAARARTRYQRALPADGAGSRAR